MVVFLDFDGVLRRHSSPKYRFDEDCRRRFEAVLKRVPGVAIVVTSSWRAGFSLDEIRGHFSIAERIVGVTPSSRALEGHYRYREILAFLGRRGMSERAWVAIDDEADHFPDGERNLLLVDPEDGFDEACAHELWRRLVRGSVESWGSDSHMKGCR